MEQNVRTAIDIDEYVAGSPLTSMVDDAFFIVQKCGRRALATGNTQCSCAVLGAANGLLGGELRAALDAKWKVSARAGVGHGASHTGGRATQTDARTSECGHGAVTPTLKNVAPSSGRRSAPHPAAGHGPGHGRRRQRRCGAACGGV